MLKWTTRAAVTILSRFLCRGTIGQPFSFSRLLAGARRVLVIPPAGLAEMLHVYPALTLLRQALPHSRVIAVMEHEQVELLRDGNPVDDIIEFPQGGGLKGLRSYRKLILEIKERMAEAAFHFDFRSDFHRLLLPLLAGVNLRVRLRGEVGYPLFNVEIVPKDEDSYFEDLHLALVRFLVPEDVQPRQWRLPQREVEIAREIVRFRKSSQAELLVGVDLGMTKSGEAPPFDVSVRLARSFAALKPSRIALLSDPDPAVKEDEIARFGDYDWLDIPRKSFRDTLAILSQCDVFVTSNTNLFHFAVAMGVPTFALFYAREDKRWIPRRNRLRVIDEERWSTIQPAELAMEMRDFVTNLVKV